jgi:Arm DNA-binding domain
VPERCTARKTLRADGRERLYLYVSRAGARSCRFKVRFGARPYGKRGQVERKLVLGTYPEVSLQEAREPRKQRGTCRARASSPAAASGSGHAWILAL